MERFFATCTQALKAVDLAYHRSLGAMIVAPSKPFTTQQAQQRRERRLTNYEQVHKLRQQGLKVLDIAHHLGIGERTVFTYLAAPSFPEWQPHPRRPGKSLLAPYKPYLLAQWNAGQRQTKRLFAEIQQQGYKGSYMTVTRYTHQLRQAQRQLLSTLEGRGHAPPVTDLKQPPLSARRATWLVLKPLKQRSVEDETLLAHLKQHPALTVAIDLAQEFADLVQQRDPKQLDRWLEQASSSSLTQFHRFAKSLQSDYAAVKAGVTLTVSNGQVEGQINRLKMLKRQMYGRAGFDLLQRRLLFAS
ncbi:transposase [Chroococcidiopsis sp. SAG 2025]|uniref:transposase n=1 Tax=Chroococcidiopsis sp. SAG 2025 TaxID=171389 RepID=UPI002936E3A1|nr:transposase [Chroococcidiopsis sp. SAG 2025]